MDRRNVLRTLAAVGIGTAVPPAWVERLLASAHAQQAGAQTQAQGAIEQGLKPWRPRALTVQQNAAVA